MNIRGVILDMDGTMFDTERVSRRAWAKIYAEEGMIPLETYEKHLNGIGQKEVAGIYKRIYGEQVDYYQLYKRKTVYMYQMLEEEGIPIKEGLYELLDFLKGAGYPIALGTSSRDDYALHCLCMAKAEQYFDAIVSGNMVEHSKPSPEIFLEAAKRIRVCPQECMVVEDSVNGIRAAIDGGFYPVMIPDMEEPNFSENQVRYVKSLRDVIGLIQEMR